jgi:cytochrome c551/c552
MIRYLVAAVTAGLAGSSLVVGIPASAQSVIVARPAGSWRVAEEIPGSGRLNSGGMAGVGSVSCASAGNCSAAGGYLVRSRLAFREQVFVVSEVRGRWGTAIEVPGLAKLNVGGNAAVNSVSCGAAGNCSAGGYFTDNAGRSEAFVVSEVKGGWGQAEEVPGSASLNVDYAQIESISCASAGNCSAGGNYHTKAGNQAFVVSEVKGTWGQAQEVPGTTRLNAGGGGFIYSVSCASPGNCSAGGTYADKAGQEQAFVVSQVAGIWGSAHEVPGTAALNRGGAASIRSVSCASAGNCGVGGTYADKAGHEQAFVASQVKGRWGKAEEIPDTAKLNAGGDAEVLSVSCASAGRCGAGGYYTTRSGNQAFVASQVKGRWGKAEEVPGTAKLNSGGNAEVISVSCPLAGRCGAAGYYSTKDGSQAFVVSQAGGKWGKAGLVPGTAKLNSGRGAEVLSVSCASPGNCSAGGTYADRSGHTQAFVTSEG